LPPVIPLTGPVARALPSAVGFRRAQPDL